MSRVRVPPGKELFVYHSHHREEELEVAAGDFMGFPAPQVAHHLRNPSEEKELVYLVGGEALDVDVAGLPASG